MSRTPVGAAISRGALAGPTVRRRDAGAASAALAASSPLRVVVLLRQLIVGGAERQIIEFASAAAATATDVTLVTFYDGGELAEAAARLGNVRVVSLAKRGRWDTLSFFVRACRTIHALRPDVLYGYQSVASELSLVIGRLVGARVVWGVRASNMDLTQYDWLWRATFRAGAMLSRFVDRIIVNSESGARHYAAAGYARERMVVIPNGINVERFAPDAAAGAAVRAEWGIAADAALVGIVGRLDPMKDHDTFLAAAAHVHARRPDVRFVCVGDGRPEYRAGLVGRSRALGLEPVVRWTGTDPRMPAVMSALDVLCSASAFGEGFSNVVGEAMACATPCVVTDCGDSARLVADCGLVVPPRSPEALGEALLTMLALAPERRRRMGQSGRRRIEDHFSVPRLVADTRAALESIA